MNNKDLLNKSVLKRHDMNFICVLLLSAFMLLAMNAAAQESQSAYNITSPITGLIKKVYVTAGQAVKKGDILLEFDKGLMLSHFSETQANMHLAKLNQSEAKKELARAEELFDRTVLSEQELQKSKILYSKAAAQYATAKNKLVHAQWMLDHAKLYAGFSGKISQIFCYPGQFVNNKFTAQALMTIK